MSDTYGRARVILWALSGTAAAYFGQVLPIDMSRLEALLRPWHGPSLFLYSFDSSAAYSVVPDLSF